MATRGRQSAASLSVARVGVDQRLAPPSNLTPAQKAVWVRMINSRPADWFNEENAGSLIQYCRHEVQANVIAKEIENFDPKWLADEEGLKRYDTLSKILDRETKNMNALLRSMRLTQQSQYRADKVVKSQSQQKPWQQ